MALLLANELQMPYVYGGGLLKFFAQEIFGGDSGKPQMQFETAFGEAWDGIWEEYAQWTLNNRHGVILEGMTAGFLYSNDNSYAIMFKASLEARAQRSDRDNRLDSLETLKQRDVEVRARWIRLFDVDVYDEQLIKDRYELMLDTSGMTITETLLATQEHLQAAGFQLDISPANAAALEEKYWEKGKEFFKHKLAAKGLMIDAGEVFRDWKEHFPKMVAELPREMRDVINKIAP